MRNSYISEGILGEPRKLCYGSIGGGEISNNTSASWFFCMSCGGKRDWSKPIPPCPDYRFGEFDLQMLMQAIGKKGYHISIRYDPDRDKNNWTVLLKNSRLCDTDDPLKCLVYHLEQNQQLL